MLQIPRTDNAHLSPRIADCGRAINSSVELHRLPLERSDASQIIRRRGFVQRNKQPGPHIGTAGHTPVRAHEHRFCQQFVRSYQQAEVRSDPPPSLTA